MMAPQRSSLFANANSIAWLALMLATGIAWWFGHTVQSAQGNIDAAVAGIIVAAAVKVLIVGFQFMEIKTAPKALQFGFAAWVIGVSIALTAICIA